MASEPSGRNSRPYSGFVGLLFYSVRNFIEKNRPKLICEYDDKISSNSKEFGQSTTDRAVSDGLFQRRDYSAVSD